jgi:hypothetical protein
MGFVKTEVFQIMVHIVHMENVFVIVHPVQQEKDASKPTARN